MAHSSPNADRHFSADAATVAQRLLDESEIAELFDAAARERFGRVIGAAALKSPTAELDRAVDSSRPPPCPGCRRTMRLVGREIDPASSHADILTFECDCGQIAIATMNQ